MLYVIVIKLLKILMLIFARQTRVASAVVFSLALVYTLSFPCLFLFSTITLSIFYLPLHLSPLPPLPPPPSTVSSRRGPRSTNPSPLLVKSFTLSPSKPRLQQRRRKKGKSRSFPTETPSSLGYSEKTSVSLEKIFLHTHYRSTSLVVGVVPSRSTNLV